VRVYSGRDASVFEDRSVLPRAFVAGATTPMSDGAALATLARGAPDPRTRAIVPRGAPAVSGARPFTPLRAERVGPDHWRMAIPPGTAGWLVLGNAYRDDWRARVDGRVVRIYPTDYAAMGLPLPRGARTVDVELDRSDLHTGAVVSLLSLLATLGLATLAVLRSRRRRATTEAPPPPGAPG
jgi:hypothetical protein